jgi:calcineurin-like phosphoesterase family protein
MIWLTGDHHFFNENIIRYCNRPYKNSQHMGKDLIVRHNRVVDPDDKVFFLGDLTLKGIEFKPSLHALIGRMNGHKHLILGNHDRLGVRDYLDIGFHSVHSSMDLEEFTLVHDPAVAYTCPSRTFLCGHIHTFFLIHKNAINVGIDQLKENKR